MELGVRAFKFVTNGHQHIKTTKDEEVYILKNNAFPPTEKQSNEVWKAPIHLENKSSIDLLVSYHDFDLMVLSLFEG